MSRANILLLAFLFGIFYPTTASNSKSRQYGDPYINFNDGPDMPVTSERREETRCAVNHYWRAVCPEMTRFDLKGPWHTSFRDPWVHLTGVARNRERGKLPSPVYTATMTHHIHLAPGQTHVDNSGQVQTSPYDDAALRATAEAEIGSSSPRLERERTLALLRSVNILEHDGSQQSKSYRGHGHGSAAPVGSDRDIAKANSARRARRIAHFSTINASDRMPAAAHFRGVGKSDQISHADLLSNGDGASNTARGTFTKAVPSQESRHAFPLPQRREDSRLPAQSSVRDVSAPASSRSPPELSWSQVARGAAARNRIGSMSIGGANVAQGLALRVASNPQSGSRTLQNATPISHASAMERPDAIPEARKNDARGHKSPSSSKLSDAHHTSHLAKATAPGRLSWSEVAGRLGQDVTSGKLHGTVERLPR
ncbi:hypothetical protein IE81DRAFT_190365 [Ceraceosorus guamensis]|uniref:Uncharacterized protein n=1 Tax=Ceraceosorus guamensis TaxID=1522189 RepID=A0A316W6A1_9BASI|nr:hypothetical protein IE81DRAFT_190365 [Ceraceosorus guamensis]PWN45417.1 hypothetical protein IE81DRAFT_190365 [Ceraceosorus guamensis]